MRRVPVFAWAIVLVFSLMWIGLGISVIPDAQKHDFLNLYTGASLALEGNFAGLHDINVQLQREKELVPSTGDPWPFVRPAFYAVLLAPLALIPYATAFWVWLAFQIALWFACWVWGFRRYGWEALVFAAFFLPAPLGIASGQDCVILLAIFILAFELADRARPVASGAVLALMLIKFHLILLWPVALLLQKRWKMLAGFCAAAAAEACVSLAFGGMKGARTYVALLLNPHLEYLSPSKERMICFQAFDDNLGIHSPLANAAIIAGILLIFLFAVHKAPLWKMFAVTAAASLLIVPHVYAYDATLLLLPFLLTIFNSSFPAARIAATIFCMPFPFVFAFGGKPWAVAASASLLAFLCILSLDSGCVSYRK